MGNPKRTCSFEMLKNMHGPRKMLTKVGMSLFRKTG